MMDKDFMREDACVNPDCTIKDRWHNGNCQTVKAEFVSPAQEAREWIFKNRVIVRRQIDKQKERWKVELSTPCYVETLANDVDNVHAERVSAVWTAFLEDLIKAYASHTNAKQSEEMERLKHVLADKARLFLEVDDKRIAAERENVRLKEELRLTRAELETSRYLKKISDEALTALQGIPVPPSTPPEGRK